MVQVIREESDDEVWQKPLREAIVNIGNSWAGGIVRKQNHAAEYAKNAANRAHETYMNQLRINSSEKISGANLKAQQARNKTLDVQQGKSFAIDQARENRLANADAKQRLDDLNDQNATAALIEKTERQTEFVIDDNGFISLKPWEAEVEKELDAIIGKSPAMYTQFASSLKGSQKEHRETAGKLQLLQTLRKKHGDGVISKIINGGDDFNLLDLKGPKGSENNDRLQSLARIVEQPENWKAILKSYEIDVPTGKMSAKAYDGLVDFGQLLVNNNLSSDKVPYSSTDINQIGITANYKNNLEVFRNPFSPQNDDNSALFAAVNNMAVGFKGLARNGVEQISASTLDFMHNNNVYFTNPNAVTSALRTRVTKIAQKGPHGQDITTYKDSTDLAIHNLLFTPNISVEDQSVMARNIMHQFVKGTNWVDGANRSGIKSVINKKSIDFAKMGKQLEIVTSADPKTTEQTSDVKLTVKNSGNRAGVLADGTATAGEQKQATMKDFLNLLPNDRLLKDLSAGYWLDPDGKVANKNKTIKGATLNINSIPVHAANNIIFSGRRDTPETNHFTNKLQYMRKLVGKVRLPRPNPQDTNTTAQQFEDFNTQEHLDDLYLTNQQIGEQIMLHSAEARKILFTSDGKYKGWRHLIQKEKEPMDWAYLQQKMGGNPVAMEMFSTIFQGLAIDKTEKDDGTHYGVDARLRRFAESKSFNLSAEPIFSSIDN